MYEYNEHLSLGIGNNVPTHWFISRKDMFHKSINTGELLTTMFINYFNKTSPTS